MRAAVWAAEVDGKQVALVVAAGTPPDDARRFLGVIVAVGDQSFTLDTQGDGRVTFTVTERTRYRGVRGLDELQPGMKAMVLARPAEDDGWVALGVGVRVKK